jgi:branched-chain amino acid transport system permease protein
METAPRSDPAAVRSYASDRAAEGTQMRFEDRNARGRSASGAVYWLLSGERVGSRVLAWALIAIVIALATAPLYVPGSRGLAAAARVCIFIVLVGSYDLLLGYTGLVSFAHTVFYGFGAYGAAIALKSWGPSWPALIAGGTLGIGAAVLLALGIGLLTLRVRNIFFSMVTLAVASFFLVLASQLSEITGGEDGMTYQVPYPFGPAVRVGEGFGVRITGTVLAYYAVFLAAGLLFLGMLRLINSPFGRVLQGIRENEFRAEALGYRVVVYRSLVSCLAAGLAAVAGVMAAVWLRYTGPNSVLSFSIMLDILLMLVIGGIGSLYGSILGATVLVLGQAYLQDAMRGASGATQAWPLLSALLHPDRWLLWLGLFFILFVYVFPKGIVGSLRRQ